MYKVTMEYMQHYIIIREEYSYSCITQYTDQAELYLVPAFHKHKLIETKLVGLLASLMDAVHCRVGVLYWRSSLSTITYAAMQSYN